MALMVPTYYDSAQFSRREMREGKEEGMGLLEFFYLNEMRIASKVGVARQNSIL